MKAVHVFTAVTGLGLQLVGVYAIAATFGALTAVELYALGGLAALLHHAIMRRNASCSPGA